MAKIIPTIGRVVWFFQEPSSPEPRAAIICYVHSDSMVNLSVFNAHGECVPTTSVPLVQDGEPHPPGWRCEWMPYQKGQAAKTEAAETALELGREVRSTGQVGQGMSGR